MRGYTEFFSCVKVSIVKTTRSMEVAHGDNSTHFPSGECGLLKKLRDSSHALAIRYARIATFLQNV